MNGESTSHPSSGYPLNVIQIGDPASPPVAPVFKGPDTISGPPSLPKADDSKRRKIERACDGCRRRKTKCDGSKMQDYICTNCRQAGKPCTYVEVSQPRGPPKAYITGLEDRMESMEALLKKIRPNSDFSDELGPPVIRGSWRNEDQLSGYVSTSPARAIPPSLASSTSTIPLVGKKGRKKSNNSGLNPSSSSVAMSTHLVFNRPGVKTESHEPKLYSHRQSTQQLSSDSSSESYPSSETEELTESYEGGMKALTLPNGDMTTLEQSLHMRFHGKSSAMPLIDATRRFKEWHFQDVSDQESAPLPTPNLPNLPNLLRRKEFWLTPNWERHWDGRVGDSQELLRCVIPNFPPADLAEQLIDLYFTHSNTFIPLLHRPTFTKQWKQQLYRQDVWFACLCLFLFAVASRWCDDPRVIPDVETSGSQGKGDLNWTHSGRVYCGVALWIHTHRRSIIHPACLFEVQTHTLVGIYMRGTGEYPVSWLLVSIGLRKAQDVGAHRKKVYHARPTVEEELWKRAVWSLIALDRIMSSHIGRSSTIGEEDYDLDFPSEVDDEYWETEDPALAFQQPPDKPSGVIAFNMWLRLTQMVAFALRTLYAIDQSKLLFGIEMRRRREEVVKQLEAALAGWKEDAPAHLRWSNRFEYPAFADQAASIQAGFHLVEILLYRPLVPISAGSPGNDAHSPISPITVPIALDPSFHAQTRCIEAGKACARIIQEQMGDTGAISNIPQLIDVAHMCAGILLVNYWDLRAKAVAQGLGDTELPLGYTSQGLLDDVHVLIKALEWARPRWGNVDQFLKVLRLALPSPDDDIKMGQHQSPSRSNTLSLSSSSSSHLLPFESVTQRRKPPFQTSPPQDDRNPHADDWKFYVATVGSEASRLNTQPQPSFVRTPSSLHQAISGQMWRRQTPQDQDQAHRPIPMKPQNVSLDPAESFPATSSWVPPTPSSSRLPPPFVPLHTRPARKYVPSISRSATSYTDQGGGGHSRSILPNSDARHRYSGNTDYREQQSPYPEFRPTAPRTQSSIWEKEPDTSILEWEEPQYRPNFQQSSLRDSWSENIMGQYSGRVGPLYRMDDDPSSSSTFSNTDKRLGVSDD